MGESSSLIGPGALIAGRYRIDRALSRGGMGTVFVARHEQTGRPFALKLMAADLTGAEEAEARFTREARLASALDHPAIIKVYDVGQHDGSPYMVMELLEGESLGARIKRGKVPPAEAVALLSPVLEGLATAHARAIVHRDLKPDNIYLAAERGRVQPKVLDFGISKLVGTEATQKLTRTGVTMGTPLYMSPEQVRGEKELDARTDVYSLGVILYEMLTAELPYRGENYANLVLEIITGGAPGIRTHDPSLPESLERVVACAMSVDRDKRYPDVTSMLTDLRAVVEHGATPNLTPRFSVATDPESRTPFATEATIREAAGPAPKRPTAALALVAAAALVGIGGVLAWPSAPTAPESPVHAAAPPPAAVPEPPPAAPPIPAPLPPPAPEPTPPVAPPAAKSPDAGVAAEPPAQAPTAVKPAPEPAPAAVPAPAPTPKPKRVARPKPAPRPSSQPLPNSELIDPFR